MMSDITPYLPPGREVIAFNPDKSLQTIAVAEAGERHWARAKDCDKLFEAVKRKLEEQAKYVVWRDSVVSHGGDRKSKSRSLTCDLDPLPHSDPGDKTVHRWRKRLCCTTKLAPVVDEAKIERRYRSLATIIDDEKMERALEDAQARCVRICEQENLGTIRGTEGTGEFERYTPELYVEASRDALGEIDLDPASCAEAQTIVKAKRFFTIEEDGLSQDWIGRVFINPPYHRELAPRFIDKLVSEIVLSHVSAAVLLVNNSTDTEWFHRAASVAQLIAFPKGRINFWVPNGGPCVLPTQGQAFFYYGDHLDRFVYAFSRISLILSVSS